MSVNVFLSRWAKLYSRPTKAELSLEPAVASLGIPYRFQHPLWALGLFPDFVLPGPRVVLEVDDPGHDTKKGRARDAERTERLRLANWHVARCTNREALDAPVETVNRMMEELGLSYRCAPRNVPTPAPKAAGTTSHGSRTHVTVSPADTKYSDVAMPEASHAEPPVTARAQRAHKKSSAAAPTKAPPTSNTEVIK